MKLNIEGWVMLYHQGQIRFSAVHDTETKETIFAKANRNTGYVFESDFNQPTVVDYYTERDEINECVSEASLKYYMLKQELVHAMVDHYIVTQKGPEWVKKAIETGRQFNVSEIGLEHDDYGKFDFFFYVDLVKDEVTEFVNPEHVQVTPPAIDPKQVCRNNYVDGKLFNYQADKEPSPPPMYFKHAGHHWIAKVDADKRLYNYRVLQWGPKAMKWYHSDDVGTCEEPIINLQGAVWLGAVEQPELPIALPRN